VSNWGKRFLRQGLVIGATTAVIAIMIAAPAGAVTERQTIYVALPLLLLIILIGIIFDIVGVAAAAVSETPFHAMAAKRVPAARTAIRLVRHADRVVSISCDVVGDLTGTISGAAGAAIAVRLAGMGGWEPSLVSLFMIAGIAGLTVGGKAAGKGLALNRCVEIILRVATVIHILERLFHFELYGQRPRAKTHKDKQGNGRGQRNHKGKLEKD